MQLWIVLISDHLQGRQHEHSMYTPLRAELAFLGAETPDQTNATLVRQRSEVLDAKGACVVHKLVT